MVHRDKEEFYKGIQKEVEDKGLSLLSVCRSRGISYNTFLHWKQRHPVSFGTGRYNSYKEERGRTCSNIIDRDFGADWAKPPSLSAQAAFGRRLFRGRKDYAKDLGSSVMCK